MNTPEVGTFSVYVHFPYCDVRCTYCDFNTYIVKTLPTHTYTQAILAELEQRRADYDHWKLTSIYFGGGTPSLWGAEGVGAVISELFDVFPKRTEHVEITMECNPGEATLDQLKSYRDVGVERLSIGVQTLDDTILKRLSRHHTGAQAIAGIRAAKAAGFRSISADIMFGLPGQSIERLTQDLRVIGDLGPEHMSVYHLTLEDGTALKRDVRARRISLPGDELQADMWESIGPTLAPYGLRFYEISSLSIIGHESRHNTAYWFGRPYLGLGAGAHSFCPPSDWSDTEAQAVRQQNLRHHRRYTKQALDHEAWVDTVEHITRLEHLRERLFTGLRHLAGIDIDALSLELQLDAREVFSEPLTRLVSQDLLTWNGTRLLLTPLGFTFADTVAEAFF